MGTQSDIKVCEICISVHLSCLHHIWGTEKNGTLDLLAKDLVTGNLQLLHIWFFTSFCSGLEASQQYYITAFKAVFK